MAASLSGCKEARKTPEILRLCNRVVNAQTRLPRPAAGFLAKVKRHNQALAKSRINSDAFSLHMRYESAIRFLPKAPYSLPSSRNANSSGTTILATDLR